MNIKANFGAILLLLSIIFTNEITYAAVYIFCAAIHEIGHLSAAKRLGIKIREMSFDIAGARIIPQGHIPSYKKEFLLCASGPLASILLCLTVLLFTKISNPTLPISSLIELISTGNSVISAAAMFSLSQALFNLIPIDGFDGSRMLGAIVSYTIGERAAHSVSLILSFAFALVLWMASVYALLRVGEGLSLFSFSLCMFLKIFNET